MVAGLPAGLASLLRGLTPVAIALSGGVDSRFLCHAALLAGCDLLALHAAGPHIPPEESAYALRWAKASGVRLQVVSYDPLTLPEVAANSRERCYACKRGLLDLMWNTLRALGEEYRQICDGSNADDIGAFRPGQRALREAGARSPLAEAGITKAELRRLGSEAGLDQPGQRARPCLLTRLDYGLRPDAAALRRLAAAEQALTDVLPPESCAFRLRLTPAPLLQATALPAAREKVRDILARHGFAPCRLCISSSVSGFFDARPAPPPGGWTFL